MFAATARSVADTGGKSELEVGTASVTLASAMNAARLILRRPPSNPRLPSQFDSSEARGDT
jgi:hypothetical protein